MSEHQGNPHDITVTIRTLAGTPHRFEVKPHDRVDKTARMAVEYFVHHGQLAEGRYGLALVRDGQATEMVGSGRLEDYGVVANDVLHLIAKDPQVDG
jgi:hypothetical protein